MFFCVADGNREMENLVFKFPPEWRGLFAALNHELESEQHADLWLLETQKSRFGGWANWDNLTAALCGQEPYIATEEMRL